MSQALQRSRPTQRAAGYIGGGGRERCAQCRFFMPATTCTRIEGPVSPRGWCRYFSQELSVLRYHPSGSVAGGVGGWTLDLSFLSGALDPRITFTRASTATYFDATGTMQTAATNAPRFDYDPVTHALRGLLIEEARTNIVTNSGSLSSFAPQNASVVAAGIVLPDGTSSGGLRLIEDTSTLEHGGDFNFVGAGSTTYTSTIFAKANTRTRVQIGLRGGTSWAGGNTQVIADLLAGTAVVVAGTATASIQSVGNGWYRIGVTATTVASPTGACYTRFSLSNNANQATYTGDGVSSAYVWGSQVEVGAFPTSYVPTLAAAVTRAIDQCSIPPANTGWFVSPGGSWMAEFIDNYHPVAYQRVIAIPPGPGSLGPLLISDAAAPGQYDGSLQFSGSVITTGVVMRAATTVSGTAGRVCLNGGAVAAGTVTGGYPGITTSGVAFMTASPAASTENTTGYLRRVRYWPRVLSDAEMQSVTT